MMKNSVRVLVANLLAVLLLGAGFCGILPAAAEGKNSTPQAAILFFQDGHEIAPVKQGTKTAPAEHGGIARLDTVLRAEEAKGVPVDIVFGGDLGEAHYLGRLSVGKQWCKPLTKLG